MTRPSFQRAGFVAAPALLALTLTAPSFGSTYEYAADDGTGYTESSLTAYDARVTWGNYFYAQDPFTTISTIRVSFGRDVTAGKNIQVAIWEDADDDGNPLNASLVALADHVVQDATGPETFADFAIDPTSVTGGFFVAVIADLGQSEVGLRQDYETLGTTSWRFDNTIGTDNFDLGAAGFGGRLGDYGLGTWMVRAIGVPTPGSIAVLGLGSVGLVIRRRRA